LHHHRHIALEFRIFWQDGGVDATVFRPINRDLVGLAPFLALQDLPDNKSRSTASQSPGEFSPFFAQGSRESLLAHGFVMR
jgi:hypothetical protein